jgi:hypothetical protein
MAPANATGEIAYNEAGAKTHTAPATNQPAGVFDLDLNIRTFYTRCY